jgi:hypothetical protein
MTTATQRLAEVRAAIQDILDNGQEVRRGDRSLKRGELDSLRALEARYAEEAAAEARAVAPRSRISRLYSRGKGI